ncbi:MAG TPA: ABC transporter permease subunit [Casimicrobiaceae bacterium]|nr:ABC transporter permease subunit [Casimicrobiaceae bacterium]
MEAPSKPFRWSWRSAKFRALVYQIAAVLLVVAAGWYLVHNTLANMRVRGIQSGYDFLRQPAGFAISESLFEFDSSETYFRAFLIGLSNTLRVAIVGIVLATLLGALIGIGRLSRNFLIRSLCGAYVETFRNVPLLLQLFMWYFILTELLPPIDEALQPIPHVFFSKNGLQYPIPVWALDHVWVAAGALVGCVGAWAWRRFARHRREASGSAPPVVLPALAIVLAGGFVGWLAGGAPSALDFPEKTEITVVGGGAVTPEFLTVLVGLTLYTASYIAEIVRGGIQAVAHGQHEAAAALGLARSQEVRLVLLPQALRVIIPPITSQYLNLTKNSSLAVAVGYPDIVSISTTTLNQTGRAIEAISIVMLCYLTMSLLTATIMNWYNRRAAIRER